MIRPATLLHRWFPSTEAQGPALHSREAMQLVLERERMRSDRGNSSFALLTLTFPRSWSRHDLNAVGRVLIKRIRATDFAGQLGRRRLGILLPETSADGAWKLAEDLCGLVPSVLPAPQCEVFLYPTPPTNGEAQGLENGTAGRSERRESRPMHTFFVQPLPRWKRAVDILVSCLALVFAAPLMLLTALAVKLTSRGPIFYAQQRDGLGGNKFWIYKFRTMVTNADALKAQLAAQNEQDGPAFKIKNDPRVTPIGRLLRRTCLDELPQLLNVLRGDMSLVGPRPLPVSESAMCRCWQRRRLDVTPGLTCIWQVEGGTKVTFTEWMRMDLRYASTRTLWNDLWLIVQTVPSVIRRDGVY